MRNNNQSNRLIKWCVIALDFISLWVTLYIVLESFPAFERWDSDKLSVFWLVETVAMMLSEWRFSSTIHERQVGANQILRRTTMLVLIQTLGTYLLLRAIRFPSRMGWRLLFIGLGLLVILLSLRFFERWLLKYMRSKGFNTRYVTIVGNGTAVQHLREKLLQNPTLGYRVRGDYDQISEFVSLLDNPENLRLGDELYLSVSRQERDLISRTALLCGNRMVKFFYVQPDEEMLNLEPVMVGEMELFTTYTSPLDDSLNRVTKRLFDIIIAIIALLFTALLLPFIFVIVKIQSPGPLFFRQRRTGLGGHEFWCYKFRSMHVNADSDTRQATLDDPRKYPFGNFMRKSNIDELPQFWNVLKGDMSVVGPRPHMLAHTEQYSRLISKYMVRHFVKPGITGWAQVTGFRGETSELWQMEGRVERDIWYAQHWSIWLDMRIIWMTVKNVIKRDEKAY